MPQTFLESLISALKAASTYNANDQAAPIAVLWTDQDRQWTALIPLLRQHLPVLTYSTYDSDTLSGPAYWLRCMVDCSLLDDRLPPKSTPILYLPGVSRQEIRAVEDCPRRLQPLAELQYRGVMWGQRNGKDWTIAAYLQAGLNIEVAADTATREALQRTLVKLAETPVEVLRQQVPLKAAWLDGLLHPDEVRTLLQWMNNPIAHRQSVSLQEWQAFVSLCCQKYRFDPDRDGNINAAQLLGEGGGAWDVVWGRYKETPQSYPQIIQLLNNAAPPVEMFDFSERWPSHNESAEEQLSEGLGALETSHSLAEARQRLEELESRHADRRGSVWAKLGLAPLALALEPLMRLAQLSIRPMGTATVGDLATAYLEWAWQIDAAALAALAIVQKSSRSNDLTIIKSAVRTLYKPWLEDSARQFQRAVQAGKYSYRGLPRPAPGTCLLFSDALRMDAGQALAEQLSNSGFQVRLEGFWAALPPVTSTSKPAFTPDPALISGQKSHNLNPTLAGRETPLTADAFRSLLEGQGFQILKGDDLGPDCTGLGWTELGQIDSYGHEHGIRLALHLEAELQSLANRIKDLLNYGWKRVQVITDHGWLLLPGGLPKAHLPEHLTLQRKGRCARLKAGSQTNYFSAPWHWDESVFVAYAPDIQCFEQGKEYEHGGLSLQECLTPLITVELALDGEANQVIISDIKWRGLRCQVQLGNAIVGQQVDLRSRPADPTTSLLDAPKIIDETGEVSLLVTDEDLNGSAAIIVVQDTDGNLRAQTPTLIGG